VEIQFPPHEVLGTHSNHSIFKDVMLLWYYTTIENNIEFNHWHWWLTSIILATWEAESRRILIQGQARQKVCKTPSQQKKLLSVMAHNCHSSYSRKPKIRGL
jgi:hypothetical protein